MSVYDVPEYEKENRSLTNNAPCQRLGQGVDRLCESDAYVCNKNVSITHHAGDTITPKTGISSRHPFVPGEA